MKILLTLLSSYSYTARNDELWTRRHSNIVQIILLNLYGIKGSTQKKRWFNRTMNSALQRRKIVFRCNTGLPFTFTILSKIAIFNQNRLLEISLSWCMRALYGQNGWSSICQISMIKVKGYNFIWLIKIKYNLSQWKKIKMSMMLDAVS